MDEEKIRVDRATFSSCLNPRPCMGHGADHLGGRLEGHAQAKSWKHPRGDCDAG